MSETQPTSTTAVEAPEAAGVPQQADAQVVAAAEAGVVEHIVPADEKHQDPEELFGGEVVEPEDTSSEKKGVREPLGSINAHP